MYTSKVMKKLDINFVFKRVSKIAFYALYLAFIGLLFLRHYFIVDFSVVIYLALIALACVFADKSDLIALAISCVCFPAVFQYKYAVIIISVAYVVKNYPDFRYTVRYGRSNYGALVLLVVMMIWELMHVVIFDHSVSEYFRSFVEIIFTFVLLVDAKKNFYYPHILRIAAFSAIASCALIILIQMKFSSYSSIVDYFAANRFGYGVEQYKDFDANFNPNGLGLICVVSASMLVSLIVTGKSKIVDYFMLVALITFSLMTMSRKVVLMYAILFAFTFLYLMNVKKRGVARSLIYLALIMLAVWLVFVILNSILPTVMQKFVSRFEVEDISNGRDYLFREYNNVIAGELGVSLFGWGIQGMAQMGAYYGVGNVSHNGTQELILCWGIEGVLLFVAFIVIIVKRSYNKKSLMNYIVLSEVLAFSQFAQMITTSLVMMFYALAYINLCYDFEKGKTTLERG